MRPQGRAIGARGSPVGPRADLSRADTSVVEHQLYVKIVNGTDPDKKSPLITLSLLQYVHGIVDTLRQMGIVVTVNKIKSTSLQNAALTTAMKKRGILRLPALTTANDVYLGEKEIRDVYEKNIQEFSAVGRRGERAVEGATPDDDLHSWYKDEMTFERADEDADETGIGESESMMDAYRDMMMSREGGGGSRAEAPRQAKQPVVPGGSSRQPPASRGAPPRARTATARPDNVRARPLDPEDAEIQDTIDRLSRDIDTGTRERAFASGGGDSYADDDGDPQDDLMEAAYWSGRADSDYL
jgi:hypothetical protein